MSWRYVLSSLCSDVHGLSLIPRGHVAYVCLKLSSMFFNAFMFTISRRQFSLILFWFDYVTWSCILFAIARNTKGKKICKSYVQRGLGLILKGPLANKRINEMENKVPLVVCITRLVAQKGLHFITHAIKHVEELVSLPLLLIVVEMFSCFSLSYMNYEVFLRWTLCTIPVTDFSSGIGEQNFVGI